MDPAALALVILTAPSGYTLDQDQRDQISVMQEGPHLFHLTYANNGAMASVPGEYAVTFGEVHVDMIVTLGGEDVGFGETVVFQPRAPWIAVPDRVTMPDGDAGTVLITLPMN